MKKTILFVVLVTLAAFVSVAIAAAPPKASSTAPAVSGTTQKESKKVKTEKFEGEIQSVDAKAMSIVVAKEKVEKTFIVDDKTKITKGKKEFPFADLKAGLSVNVKYKMDGDKAIAVTIKVKKMKVK